MIYNKIKQADDLSNRRWTRKEINNESSRISDIKSRVYRYLKTLNIKIANESSAVYLSVDLQDASEFLKKLSEEADRGKCKRLR